VVEEDEESDEDDLIGNITKNKISVQSDKFFDQPSRQAALTDYKIAKNGLEVNVNPLNNNKEITFLLDISKYASRNVEGLRPGTTVMSSNGKFLYHISIIDYLQKYNWNKKCERYFKIVF
jgi:hypothetical protein